MKILLIINKSKNMRNNNNSIQKQINKINYEKYMSEQLLRIENATTQILNDSIKTHDLGLVTLALLNKHESIEVPNERGVWVIKKNKDMEDLYIKYKNKEALVEPLVYSKTLANLITTRDSLNYA